MPRTRRPLTPEAARLLDRAAEADADIGMAILKRDGYARAALAAGASWREVGAALCISPQAAHKRFNGDRTGQT